MDDLGGKPTIFGNIHSSSNHSCWGAIQPFSSFVKFQTFGPGVQVREEEGKCNDLFSIWLPYVFLYFHMTSLCLPYVFHIFAICLPYVFHMFAICLPYVFHMFAIFCSICFATAGGTAFCYRVKNLTGSNPNPTPTLQPLLDSLPGQKKTWNKLILSKQHTGIPEKPCVVYFSCIQEFDLGHLFAEILLEGEYP